MTSSDVNDLGLYQWSSIDNPDYSCTTTSGFYGQLRPTIPPTTCECPGCSAFDADFVGTVFSGRGKKVVESTSTISGFLPIYIYSNAVTNDHHTGVNPPMESGYGPRATPEGFALPPLVGTDSNISRFFEDYPIDLIEFNPTGASNEGTLMRPGVSSPFISGSK